MNNDIFTRDEFLSDLKLRTGYSKGAIDVVLRAIEDLLTDATRYRREVKVRGLFDLRHKVMPAYNGVNAHKSKLAGETVWEDFPEHCETRLHLAYNIRRAGYPAWHSSNKKKVDYKTYEELEQELKEEMEMNGSEEFE